MARKSSRREFLGSRVVPPGREPASSPEASAQPYLIQVSRPAMASQFEVFFNVGQYPDPTAPGLESLDRVTALEEQLSFFRDESEISRVNRYAAGEPVEVDPGLFNLLKYAMDLSAETGGAFDITSAPLWEAWGFARRAGKVPSAERIAEAMQFVGWHQVELDPARWTVRFKKRGVRINLGSMGKGYALDRAAEVLADAGIEHFLYHGGQSSILARGSPMQPGAAPAPETAGWTIGVRHPLRPDLRWAEIRLRDRALGTSAGTFQSFRHEGRRYVHIIDPRTGRPAEGVVSVTVVAPTATQADALSTAFFVMGPEKALDYCQTHSGIGAIIASPDRSGGFQLHTTGLTGDFRILPRQP